MDRALDEIVSERHVYNPSKQTIPPCFLEEYHLTTFRSEADETEDAVGVVEVIEMIILVMA
jgi:hypothetical protein